YYYMDLNNGPTFADNETKRLVVEDTKDSSGAQYRKVYGLNSTGRKLREVFIDNPASSPKYWCQSWTLVTSPTNALNHIAEYRPPSAHNVSTSTVDEFLNPFDDTGSGSWANDTSTLRAASDSAAGPTYVFSYDSDGRETDKRVKKGYDSTDLY